MEIIKVKLEDLKPYRNNAKIHTAEQIEQIKKSIEEFGFNDPIAIWGKENLIVEGHGRLLAVKELGYNEVDCIRLDHLTNDERKAYTLAHNKTTMNTDFDMDVLDEELKALFGIINMNDFGFPVQIEDIDEIDLGDGEPDEIIARELNELNDYVVLEFSNFEEWGKAEELLGVKRVCTSEDNEKIRRHGFGRVINGGEVLDRLQKLKDIENEN